VPEPPVELPFEQASNVAQNATAASIPVVSFVEHRDMGRTIATRRLTVEVAGVAYPLGFVSVPFRY